MSDRRPTLKRGIWTQLPSGVMLQLNPAFTTGSAPGYPSICVYNGYGGLLDPGGAIIELEWSDLRELHNKLSEYFDVERGREI